MNNILIQCGDHYENQRRLLSLALFLKARGYNPIMILYKKLVGNLFLENGIDTISISSIEKSKFVVKQKNQTFSLKRIYKGISMQDIYTMDILKTPYLFNGKKLGFRIEKAISKIDAIDKIVKQTSPLYVFIWNGYTGIVANILRSYCIHNKIKRAYLERGLLKDSVFIDEKGTNGSSSLSSLKKIPKLKLKYKYEAIVKDKDNYIEEKIIPSRFKNKKIIFIPLQVQNDTNILLYSKEINTMRQLVLITSLNMGDDYICVVRPHPEEDKDTNLNLPIFDNLIVTTEGDLKQWILLSSIIITINSTVGLESLLEKKKVFCFGNSIYSNKALTIDTNIEKFNLKDTSLFKLDQENIINYYNYLIEMHTCYDITGTLWLRNKFPLLSDTKKGSSPFNDRKLDIVEFNKYISLFLDKIKLVLSECNAINIVVNLDDKNVNLTYRNFDVHINRDYILSRAKQFFLDKFELHIDKKINIFNIISIFDIQKNNNFNILMIDETKYEYSRKIKYDLIVDPYFNIHPLNKFKERL